MAKVTGPLLSISASGSIKKTLTYGKNKGLFYCKGNRLRKIDNYMFEIKEYTKQTQEQEGARSVFRQAIEEYNLLTPSQKKDYENQASGKRLTGLNIFVRNFIKEYYNSTELLLEWLFAVGLEYIILGFRKSNLKMCGLAYLFEE